MIALIAKLAKGKIIIPVFLLFCFFNFFIFPKYNKQLSTIAGEPVSILDRMPSYTPQQVKELFEKIEKEGRSIHAFVTGKIDMVYPLVYGILSMLLIAFLLQKTFGEGTKVLPLAFWIPLSLLLSDYIENFRILALLDAYPNLEESALLATEKISLLKLTLSLFTGGVILFSGMGWIIRVLLTMLLARKRSPRR